MGRSGLVWGGDIKESVIEVEVVMFVLVQIKFP